MNKATCVKIWGPAAYIGLVLQILMVERSELPKAATLAGSMNLSAHKFLRASALEAEAMSHSL